MLIMGARNTYTRWTPERDEILKKMVLSGESCKAVSLAVGATQNGVHLRVRKLGLVFFFHAKRAPPEMSGLELMRHGLEKTINRRTVKKENGCIEWIGATSRCGYGMIRLHRKPFVVSRVVMQVHLGRILDPREFVCHRCDNSSCVNVDHLFLGTQKDNMQDAKKKGRMRGMFEKGHSNGENQARGERAGSAKLTDDSVREMRRLKLEQGIGSRRLSRIFGVSRSAAKDVIKNQTWRHVIP
jgi:hypothetical protein